MHAFTPYTQGVYLLHLHQPHFHAQHYLGFAKDVDKRLMHHWECKGCMFCSKYMRALRELGYTWELARVWVNGTRTLERELKNRHNGRMLCPICKPTGPLGERPYILTPQAQEAIYCPF